MTLYRSSVITALLAASVLTGCTNNTNTPQASTPKEELIQDDVAVERAKLTSADRALVDAQEWCVVSNDERLGSMGTPIKLDIKGQPVFICCTSCKRKAEADSDKTLAKVEDLKAKAKAEKVAKK